MQHSTAQQAMKSYRWRMPIKAITNHDSLFFFFFLKENFCFQGFQPFCLIVLHQGKNTYKASPGSWNVPFRLGQSRDRWCFEFSAIVVQYALLPGHHHRVAVARLRGPEGKDSERIAHYLGQSIGLVSLTPKIPLTFVAGSNRTKVSSFCCFPFRLWNGRGSVGIDRGQKLMLCL